VLLQAEGVVAADLEELGDIGADALVDLVPQVEVVRVERVVEVEHPGVDVGEGACGLGVCGRVHGARCSGAGRVNHSRNRTVGPCLPAMWITGKRVGVSPCAGQFFCSPISNFTSPVQSCVGPPQASVRSPRLTAWPSRSTASAKLNSRAGFAGTSGLTHLPASTRYQPRVVTAPCSSTPIAALTANAVSLPH